MSKDIRLRLECTSKKYPAIWECGGPPRHGEASEIVLAQVIAHHTGMAMRPIHVPGNAGQYADPQKRKLHALFVARPGQIIVHAGGIRSQIQHRGTAAVDIRVYKIQQIRIVKWLQEMVIPLYRADLEEVLDVPECYQKVVDAAIRKACCFGCDGPHFAMLPEGDPRVCRQLRLQQGIISPDDIYLRGGRYPMSEDQETDMLDLANADDFRQAFIREFGNGLISEAEDIR